MSHGILRQPLEDAGHTVTEVLCSCLKNQRVRLLSGFYEAEPKEDFGFSL